MGLKDIYRPDQEVCIYRLDIYTKKGETYIAHIDKVTADCITLYDGSEFTKSPMSNLYLSGYSTHFRDTAKLFNSEADATRYEEGGRLLTLLQQTFHMKSFDDCEFTFDQLKQVAEILKLN